MSQEDCRRLSEAAWRLAEEPPAIFRGPDIVLQSGDEAVIPVDWIGKLPAKNVAVDTPSILSDGP